MRYRGLLALGWGLGAVLAIPAAAQVPMGGSGAALPTTLATLSETGGSQPLAFASAGNAAYDVTLNGNTSFTITGGTAGQFQTITAVFRQGGSGGFTPSLPANVQWASGSAPVFSTSAGTVTTVIFGTSDGGKTIVGLSGGTAIGTVAGTARDAAAAIAAEGAAASGAASANTAVSNETSRAQTAEAGLLPKSGTTVAGLTLASSPTAGQVAAALPTFTSSAAGLGPAPGSGANQVLGQSGWTAMTGGGNVSTDSAGTITGQLVRANGAQVSRTLGARATDQFNVRDFGAAGTGQATAIGTTYGSTLAALASYTVPGGATPFAWATNPAFGLTFTMTTSAAQSAAGAALTFGEPLISHEGLPFQATVAAWQDPSNANFLLQPGMLVSGACIASGTTVQGWTTTAVRQGELLPGSTDWAAGATYAANATVAANGNFYQATTGGTSGNAGGPSGTGSNIADGSAVWKFLSYGESTRLPNGTVTLSQATSSACASGAAITFTIAPAQLQALTTDWLGIQSAMAQAWALPTGARVYIPAGSYEINHPLMNAGGMTNGNTQTLNIEIIGDGFALTQINVTADAGQDECAIGESNRGLASGNEVSSESAYRNFRLNGPAPGPFQYGVSPAKMDGLCVGADARIYEVETGGFRAGVTLVKDHQELHGLVSSGNGYGLLFAPYSETMGNQLIEDGGLAGNFIASVGITSTDQLDSATMKNVHTGFSPYGFYALPSTPNVSVTNGGMVSNSTLFDVWTEAVGEGWMYGAGGHAAVGGTLLINTGGQAIGYGAQIPNGTGGVVQPAALINVYSFDSNTMVGTTMGPYSHVTQAIILASGYGGCTNNLWINDPAFVLGASATQNSSAVTPLYCPYGAGAGGNSFQLGSASGVFRMSGNPAGPMAANVPVQDGYSPYGSGALAAPYTDGNPFLGVTAAASYYGNWVGIYHTNEGLSGLPLAMPSQNIHPGQPIFVTSGGVEGGMDQAGAIGNSLNGCSGGNSSNCYFTLNPAAHAGAHGASTGLTASGTNQSTAYQVTSALSQFSTVASGAGAILGIIPVGSSETVCNDGAAALNVYAPVGDTIGTAATTAAASVATGVCRSFFRTGSTTFH